ncbi:hypothetical protein SHIRM173S_05303 [Streptomyces hirsutus]
MELIGPGPAAEASGDPLAELFAEGPSEPPADPVLRRLFPDAYGGPEADLGPPSNCGTYSAEPHAALSRRTRGRIYQRPARRRSRIATSVVFMGIGVVLNYVVPEKAFGYVTSIATAAGIWTWLMILISHILYRRQVVAGRLPASSFPAPGGSVCSYIAIVFLLFVTALIAIDAEARICLYVMAGWAFVLGIGWVALKSRNPRITEGREPEFEKIGG